MDFVQSQQSYSTQPYMSLCVLSQVERRAWPHKCVDTEMSLYLD